MAQEWAQPFYNSGAWHDCRDAYLSSVGGMCERCQKAGIIRPADVVHHREHLSRNNIGDPAVALSFDNLMALCTDCHAAVHAGDKRFLVDANGRVRALEA